MEAALTGAAAGWEGTKPHGSPEPLWAVSDALAPASGHHAPTKPPVQPGGTMREPFKKSANAAAQPAWPALLPAARA
jgi:hypothetical protein